MLSRVADSALLGPATSNGRRTRAGFTARQLSRLLDANVPDRGRAWRGAAAHRRQRRALPRALPDVHRAKPWRSSCSGIPRTPIAVAACVARARENARGAREQISSEMWEGLNRLHLLVSARATAERARRAARLLRARPRELPFVPGRDEGDAARGRGVRVFSSSEPIRSGPTSRARAGHQGAGADRRARDQPTAARLSSLLKSCGAFEAYSKLESDELRADRVVEFLLLERRFPRAVLFCLERCLEAIRSISGGVELPERRDRPTRGRNSRSPISPTSTSSRSVRCSRVVLQGLTDAANEIADAYFTTRVILPGPYASQQSQQ